VEFKYLVVGILVLILISLGRALYYLTSNKEADGGKMVKALAWRIGLPGLDRSAAGALNHPRLPRYSQYTKINSPSQTTSTKCQYQDTASKPKCRCGVKWPLSTLNQMTVSMMAPTVTCMP